ncbi:MAG: hypothetical protein JW798_04885 [Prolixibacteraceae bacterium]|nr:hypothetical protein [Prolixibacteraceae bacterium]
MKNLEVMGIREMDAVEMRNENGGFVFGFNWGAFWEGCKIGIPLGGAAAGIAYYATC